MALVCSCVWRCNLSPAAAAGERFDRHRSSRTYTGGHQL